MLGRMDLPEMAGLLFHPSTSFREARRDAVGRREALENLRYQIQERHLSHFLVRGSVSGDDLTAKHAAEWLNALQDIAADSRLGIPLTFSSDPRHGPSGQVGIRNPSGHLSQWPEPIGFGAIGDPGLVIEHGRAVRAEYRALGIHVALHPQADLATEPRWMRTSGTFGQDPDLVSELVRAYVTEMQGARLGPDSVACMVKHFPGGGPQEHGEDPHFDYGKNQIYPAGKFEVHLTPFRAALEAGCSQVMPYYGRPVGLPGVEEVGFGFNRSVITGILREKLGFDGVVCTDWGIITDHVFLGDPMPAIAWGMESATPLTRLHIAIEAGVDQFGGEECVDLLVKLVEDGAVSGERILESARRLLRIKFELGIVDSPQVDTDRADDVVGHTHFQEAGRRAHRRSVTVLTNRGRPPLLPLQSGCRVRSIGLSEEQLDGYAVVDLGAAISIMMLETPFDERSVGFQRVHRAGRLAFAPEDLEEILERINELTVVLILLDRPAVIPEIVERAGAVVAHWGGPLDTVLDTIFGRAVPEGRLPFDLPRSAQAVSDHPPDLPGGSSDPVARFGDSANLDPWQPRPFPALAIDPVIPLRDGLSGVAAAHPCDCGLCDNDEMSTAGFGRWASREVSANSDPGSGLIGLHEGDAHDVDERP